MVLDPVSPAIRFQVRSAVGPATTVPSIGVPRAAVDGLGPAGLMAKGALFGPHPSPLQAATSTLAAPAGTGSVTDVVESCRAATVRAPPPGPAGGGCTTWIWYRSAPDTADQVQVMLFPVTGHDATVGAVDGGGIRSTEKSTALEKGPQVAWQPRTCIR